MKTITKLFIIISIAIFSACEGPMGPPGYDGEDGLDGTSLLGTVFETTVDFTAGNEYSVFFQFPNDFEIFGSDIIMVYILWEQADTDNGVVDVWRALPQNVFLEDGIIQYNFDRSVADVRIFIENTIGSLLPSETDNQTFRIAVIPAQQYANKSIEIEDMDAVLKSLEINPESIRKF